MIITQLKSKRNEMREQVCLIQAVDYPSICYLNKPYKTRLEEIIDLIWILFKSAEPQ